MIAALLVSLGAHAQDDEQVLVAESAPESAPEADRLLRYEINIEAGSLANSDPMWDFVGGGSGMPSWGLSAGYRVIDRVAIVGAWHHVRRGADVTATGGTDTDADFDTDLDSFVAAWFGNEYSLGAKADVSLADAFLPFVSAQALLLQSQVKLDGDPEANDDVNEAKFAGVAPGVLLLTGAEVRFPPDERWQVGLDLELGYGWLAETDLGALGPMKAGGFVIRSGLGVRF